MENVFLIILFVIIMESTFLLYLTMHHISPIMSERQGVLLLYVFKSILKNIYQESTALMILKNS